MASQSVAVLQQQLCYSVQLTATQCRRDTVQQCCHVQLSVQLYYRVTADCYKNAAVLQGAAVTECNSATSCS